MTEQKDKVKKETQDKKQTESKAPDKKETQKIPPKPKKELPSTSKIRKKIWYPILAPKMFHNVELGETFVYEPNAMIGKTITQNLMNLTNDIKKQNVNMKFEVESIENNKAKTKIIAFNIVPATVKRLARRDSRKMDISFTCKTKDNVPMRIKPLLVTRTKISNSILTKLRRIAIDFISKKIKSDTYENAINNLVFHKIQGSLREHLKKTYPLKTCEIRYAGIERVKVEGK